MTGGFELVRSLDDSRGDGLSIYRKGSRVRIYTYEMGVELTPADLTVLIGILTETLADATLAEITMTDQPRPCPRHNAHTPHQHAGGQCPGTAPEFPWEPVEDADDD